MKITAKIAEAKIIRRPDSSLSGYCIQIEGRIYEDSRERFKDGDRVTTSRVMSIDSTGMCITQNSAYQLI